MPTLDELRKRVHNATGGMYTDLFHMTDLINDALNQMVEGARLRGEQSLSIVMNTNTYALPADFKSPGQLLDMDNPDSILAYELIDLSENSLGYSIKGSDIIIKPSPMESKTLTHYYYKYATPLVAGTDVPEIDAQYHDALSFYAAGMILLLPQLNQSATLADRYLSRWDSMRESFMVDMQRKNKASRGRVVNQW